jgi:hypothetical protein
MTPAAITIVLDDRRKRLGLWWQKLQHAVGGAPLLIAGVHRLQSPGGTGDLLAIAEIAVAAVLLVLLARDLRSEVVTKTRTPAPDAPPAHAHAHAHAHGGPDWFDVVAGALLILEAVHSSHAGGKPFYARPVFLLGVATGMIGLAHGRLARLSWKRREIHLDESGVRARLSRFRSFTLAWQDIRRVRATDSGIVIETAAGSHTIALRRYGNAAEIREAFAQWDAARALPDAS